MGTSNTVVARASRVLWREGPDCVLVRRVGDEALELTGIAAFVWHAVATPRSVDELRHELAAAAGLATLDDELDRTVDDAIDRLTTARVLTRA